jgi:hypothetical protein
MKYLMMAVSLSILLPCYGFAQEPPKCGKAPEFDIRQESTEKLKGDLKGKAQALTKFLGSAELAGKIESERKELYRTSDKSDAARQDAYLAYMFCTIITEDTTLTPLEKIKAIREFRKPISDSGLPLSKARIQLTSWSPRGWDILVTNPTKQKVAVTRGTLVTPTFASAGSSSIDIIAREDFNKYSLEISQIAGSDQPFEIGTEKTTVVHARVFYCTNDGPENNRQLGFLISKHAFQGDQCDVCLQLTALDGENTLACDSFECRRIQLPSIACPPS